MHGSVQFSAVLGDDAEQVGFCNRILSFAPAVSKMQGTMQCKREAVTQDRRLRS